MKSVARFYVENFGCRATQADGAAIERQFQERGFARAGASKEADLVVLNTCTVTASADQEARAAIRRVHRDNPRAQIVVTGCYAQRAPEEIAAIPGVSRVIGNSHKQCLAELVMRGQVSSLPETELGKDVPRRAAGLNPSFLPLSTLTIGDPKPGDQIIVSNIFAHTELLAAPVFEAANARTRPNLKVQDGCDNRCSFCVIPSVRGNSRSLNKNRILREVNALVSAGYREVVISGINLGRWGRDLRQAEQWAFRPSKDGLSDTYRPAKFEYLVRAILQETALEKLRISSIEPMDWSDELIQLMASSPRIAKHAHVPMQSGSDAVLRRMHRKYRPWHYREKIEKIRTAMPAAAIGADVMVGFPGESDAEFAETCRMIEDLPFTYLHVFTYSARPGTAAAQMPNQISVRVAQDRNRILRELAAEKKLAFMRNFLGAPIEAITLNVRHANYTESLTDNYLKLRLEGAHMPNRWLCARVTGVEDGMLVGHPAQPPSS